MFAAKESSERAKFEQEREELQNEIHRKNLSLASALEALHSSDQTAQITRVKLELEKQRRLSFTKVCKAKSERERGRNDDDARGDGVGDGDGDGIGEGYGVGDREMGWRLRW